jgi:hypothetical protein
VLRLDMPFNSQVAVRALLNGWGAAVQAGRFSMVEPPSTAVRVHSYAKNLLVFLAS